MALENIPGDDRIVAVGASGFGIMAIIVGVERGFVGREEGARRMLRIVEFLARADRFHGVWPHFLDGNTGKVLPVFGPGDDGGDLVETAFLLQGLPPASTSAETARRSVGSIARSPGSGKGSSGTGTAAIRPATSSIGTGPPTTAGSSATS
jgi:hypothetical protein